MTCTVVPDPKVEATLRKMWQKDSARFGQIEKKLQEQSGKPGRSGSQKKPLAVLRRLHIGHYILIYKTDKKNQKITLVDYSKSR
jgi:mRNA-degrading endonuclease RelE of RelBE toxin-antitoxin system